MTFEEFSPRRTRVKVTVQVVIALARTAGIPCGGIPRGIGAVLREDAESVAIDPDKAELNG